MSRVVAVLAALLVAVATVLTSAGGAAAQATSTFTLNLATCRVEGSADSIEIKPSFQAGDNQLDRDCVQSWQPRRPDPQPFSLDGQAPDGGDGVTTVSWSDLTPRQSYTLEDGVSGALNPSTVTMPASGDLTLWAVLYKFYTPTDTPVPTVTATEPGAGTTLPQTGTGTAQSHRTTGSIVLLAGVAVLLLSGAWVTVRRRQS